MIEMDQNIIKIKYFNRLMIGMKFRYGTGMIF